MVESNEEESRKLMYIYEWIDGIELSKPKKNIARDFCDGLLVAEIVKSYLPKLVDIHNYPATSSSKQKKYNWNTLNGKVLKKLGLQMSNKEIDDVIQCKPLAIEHLLERIYKAIQKTPGVNLVPKAKAETKITRNQHKHNEEEDKRKEECLKVLEEKEISVQKLNDIVNELELELESSNQNIKAQEMKVEELMKLSKSRGLNA